MSRDQARCVERSDETRGEHERDRVPPWPIRSPSAVLEDGQLLPLSAYSHPSSGAKSAPRAVEGLRMSQGSFHTPALVEEVLAIVREAPAGVIVDATVGGGGHAEAILEARADVVVLGIDQDRDALDAAEQRLSPYGGRAILRHGRFDALRSTILTALPAEMAHSGVAAILFDLGVSSHQLDDPERGFSYRFDGPLDMRMDREAQTTAADLVNSAEQRGLEHLFAEQGEERFARRIAKAIIAARPIQSTEELAAVVASAIPAAARRRGHPARRIFQALRIAVNDELETLAFALDEAFDVVVPSGRVVVLSYHSGEDRIVKAHFRNWSTGGCTCPPGLPCVCGARPLARLLTHGAVRATAEEIARNPRSREARLRAVERLAEPINRADG